MKKLWKRFLVLSLALLAVLALSTTALAEEEGEAVEAIEAETVETVVDGLGVADNDELFYQYMLQQARGETATLMERTKDGVDTAGAKLTGINKKVYDVLVAEIRKVARGERNSTSFAITAKDLGYKTGQQWLFSDLGVSTKEAAHSKLFGDYNPSLIINALLVDLPYDLYWYQKTTGTSYSSGVYGYSYNSSYITIADESDTMLEYNLPVSVGYRASEDVATTTSSTKVVAANNASNNAKAVIESHAVLSDYNKLLAYKNAICNAVEYNSSAADNDDVAYGDPWQLVYVFDGDGGTNVVCEGYAKAFKYLCDLSTFENNIQCYIATGNMGTEGHMWNIVTMEDGKNYLVDVTNCDGNSYGNPDKLFLKGVDTSTGTNFTVGNGWYSEAPMTYTYDDKTKAQWPSELLTLSTTDYVAVTEDSITVTKAGSAVTVSGLLLKGHQLIVAEYTEGKFVNLTILYDGKATVNQTINNNLTVAGGTVKVFILDTAYRPVAEAKTPA